MPAYDREWFSPPAPLAHVTLRNSETGVSVTDVPLLLDTGADVTLVPRSVLAPLGISPIPGRHYELLSFDAGSSLAEMVRLELLFCRRVFRGQYLVIEQPWGILGRNVLNAIPLLLDGPSLAWTEQRQI
jgi:hypothetical protein